MQWEPESESLVTIAHFMNEQQFLTARMALEGAGIEVFATNEHLTRITGGIYNAFTGGIAMKVRESDSEAARTILDSPQPFVISESPED